MLIVFKTKFQCNYICNIKIVAKHLKINLYISIILVGDQNQEISSYLALSMA